MAMVDGVSKISIIDANACQPSTITHQLFLLHNLFKIKSGLKIRRIYKNP